MKFKPFKDDFIHPLQCDMQPFRFTYKLALVPNGEKSEIQTTTMWGHHNGCHI